MEKETKDNQAQHIINTDILSIFKLANGIQWKEVRQNSIYRILYLATVLYRFRYPNETNLFSNYKFSIEPSGPYDSNISQSLIFLMKDNFLDKVDDSEDILKLNINNAERVFKIGIDNERYDWLKQVVYILGIYGENKIYDFIFRDPQYQTTIMSNTQQGLYTGDDNETVKTLQGFQEAFEETLNNKNKISSQTYLELYFEYIFSKILKRIK